jgi:hypothetical protein
MKNEKLTSSKKSITIVNEMDKPGSSSEELIIKKQVEHTPFEIVTIGNKNFVALGQYRLTPEDYTFEKCEMWAVNITWNKIVQVSAILHEIITKNSK